MPGGCGRRPPPSPFTFAIMAIDLLLLFGGGVILIGGGEILVRGAAALARSLGVSTMIIGLTVVA